MALTQEERQRIQARLEVPNVPAPSPIDFEPEIEFEPEPSSSQTQPPSTLGQVYENIAVRPATAIRGGIQAMGPGGETPLQGYLKGVQQPSSIPTFQSQALDAYYGALGQAHPERAPSFGEGLMGNLPSALGFGADVLTNPADVLLGLLPGAPGIKQGLSAVAKSPTGQAVGRLATTPLGRQKSTMAGLMQTPEAKLGTLPPEVREMYLKGRRAQLMTLSHEAKVELNRIHRQTFEVMEQDTARLTAQLNDQAYQAALRLKQVDAKPLLRAQSDRYAQLTGDAIDQTPPGVLFRPRQLVQAIEKEFQYDPKDYVLAYEQLGMEQLVNDPSAVFTPRQILDRIEGIGKTIPRSPTQVYSHVDSVKDRLRGVLLKEMETSGVKTKWIQEAQQGWKRWKPVQRRLVRETRLFEESEQVSDVLVSNLAKYALGDTTKNNTLFYQSLEKYLGRELATPMKATVGKLSYLERKQVALEAAKLAEEERIALQSQGGRNVLQNLELQTKMQVARAQRLWNVIKGIGVIGGGLYGVKQVTEAVR